MKEKKGPKFLDPSIVANDCHAGRYRSICPILYNTTCNASSITALTSVCYRTIIDNTLHYRVN